MAIQSGEVTPTPEVQQHYPPAKKDKPVPRSILIWGLVAFLSMMWFNMCGRRPVQVSNASDVLPESVQAVETPEQAAERRRRETDELRGGLQKITDDLNAERAKQGLPPISATPTAGTPAAGAAPGANGTSTTPPPPPAAASVPAYAEDHGGGASRPAVAEARPKFVSFRKPAESSATETAAPTAPDPDADPAIPSTDGTAELRRLVQQVAPGLLAAPQAPPASQPTARAEKTSPATANAVPGAFAEATQLRSTTLAETTWLDGALINRLNSTAAGPVKVIITNPVYGYDGRVMLIPPGAFVLGTTTPIQANDEERMAIAFHRLILPDGRSYSLNQFKGMSQIGDVGLRDKVNNHYRAMFGAAALTGLIDGATQALGRVGQNQNGAVIFGGIGNQSNQSAQQIMQRFTSRRPSLIIEPGHIVKVHVNSDMELPAWKGQMR